MVACLQISLPCRFRSIRRYCKVAGGSKPPGLSSPLDESSVAGQRIRSHDGRPGPTPGNDACGINDPASKVPPCRHLEGKMIKARRTRRSRRPARVPHEFEETGAPYAESSILLGPALDLQAYDLLVKQDHSFQIAHPQSCTVDEHRPSMGRKTIRSTRPGLARLCLSVNL